MTEKNEVVHPCRALIKQRGGKSLKVQPIPNSGIETGTPDILACYSGMFVAAECKRMGEQPEPIQEARLRQWSRAGGVAVVVRSKRAMELVLDVIDGKIAKDTTRYPWAPNEMTYYTPDGAATGAAH